MGERLGVKGKKRNLNSHLRYVQGEVGPGEEAHDCRELTGN